VAAESRRQRRQRRRQYSAGGGHSAATKSGDGGGGDGRGLGGLKMLPMQPCTGAALKIEAAMKIE
jgi:hypothetical protein